MTLPSGTVTFCFTDIEGSTQLFAKLGPRFLDVLEEHRRIIRKAVAAHGGAEVKTEGDGFFLAFPDASAAVHAAIDSQRALAVHTWPAGATVRIRIGLHVGEAKPIDDDYVSFAVHEAARISAAAHGGQTVVSDVLARLVGGQLGAGVTLRDLGTHELKDVASIRLHQVCHPDLPDDFPPLRSVSMRRGYVPTPASSIVGRNDAIDELLLQLRTARLVTVTGAGGVGKTRLAVEVARALLGSRPDGIWFIDLAPVTDPAYIPVAMLDALGIVRETAVDASTQLFEVLRSRDVLLVIDNCEHVIEASSVLIEDAVRACPGVAVLATSREPLGIAGEIAWRLRSLEPAPGADLFVERARAVAPHLELDNSTDAAIAQIVERLDGIPLAIELAAARTRVLSPAQIADRLDDRFRLLTGGSRTAIARQRTLEATVDWSYGLLDEDERSLLRVSSVFAGGFTLDAAEAVGGIDALDLLERLVDKSLVSVHLVRDAVRYRLLETIRHYAWNKLTDSGGMRETRDRHLEYFADLVDAVGDGLRDRREMEVADVLTREHDNVRAALDWALSGGDRTAALRIVAQMWQYWEAVGRAREGYDWLTRALEDTDSLDTDLVSLVHAGAAHLAFLTQQPDADVLRFAQLAVDRARERSAVRWWDALATMRLGYSFTPDEDQVQLLDEATRLSRLADDSFTLTDIQLLQADRAGALQGGAAWLAALEEILPVARASGAASQMANVLGAIAQVSHDLGDLERALATAQEALAYARKAPNVWLVCHSLWLLAYVNSRLGHDDAERLYDEVIDLAQDAGLYPTLAATYESIARYHLNAGRQAVALPWFERGEELLRSVATHRPQLLLQWGRMRAGIGECAQMSGDFSAAREIFDELDALADESTAAAWVRGLVRNAIAALDLEVGDVDAAEAGYVAALEVVSAASDHVVREGQVKAASVRGLAAVAFARGDALRAAALSGAAADFVEPNAQVGGPALARNRDVVSSARQALGDTTFEEEWSRGVELGMEGAIADVISGARRA